MRRPLPRLPRCLGSSAEKIARFLMDPHPKDADRQLSRDETRDLGAYIARLAR